MFQVRLAPRKLVWTLSAFRPKEVESYSYQFFIWTSSLNGDLHNGYKKSCVITTKMNDNLTHSLKIFVFLHGLMIWRVMQRNVRSDIVS